MAFWTKRYNQLRAYLHRQTLPGFKGITIAVVLKYLWKEIQRDDIVTRSNSMAYCFFLSIFPGLLVLLTLLPYLPLDDLLITIRKGFIDFLPRDMANYMDNIIVEMTQTSRTGLLSLSIILALVFASNGVLSMVKGFHKSYEMTYKEQNTFQQRWRAFWLTMLLGLLFIGSLVMIIIGRPLLIKILAFSGVDEDNFHFFNFMRWLGVFVIYYISITITYTFGPAYRNKEKLFSPGATLATILSVISSFGFAIYVDNFSNYNQIYGSIGALMLILVWLQINSFIILLGYELNASIVINRDLFAYEKKKALEESNEALKSNS